MPDKGVIQQLIGGQQAEYLYTRDLPDGYPLRIKILRKRRKTMGLYASRQLPTELRVPIKCPWTEILGFLEEKQGWIVAAEQEMAAKPKVHRNDYSADGQIVFLGCWYRLRLQKSQHAIVQRSTDTVTVFCSNPSEPRQVEQQILRWYRREAEQLFDHRMQELCRTFPLQVAPTGLIIRKMKSRWGSCSSTGEICLNLWLVQESLTRIDYVITHELCHLHHFAHDDAFYGLLDQAMPEWRRHERMLDLAC